MTNSRRCSSDAARHASDIGLPGLLILRVRRLCLRNRCALRGWKTQPQCSSISPGVATSGRYPSPAGAPLLTVLVA
jgi:hypothetical protein